MKNVLLWILSITLFAGYGWAEDAPDAAQSALAIAIDPTHNDGGMSMIEHDGTFTVRFTNRSKLPIRLWQEHCQLGYGTLSFRVEEEAGVVTRMQLSPRHSWDWKNRLRKSLTIPSGGDYAWEVHPSSIWGERVWSGVPEPNTGKTVAFQAVYQVEPTKETKEDGVWTGRVESKKIETLVVNPNLRSPHSYLEKDCPKQALRMIQADRTWIGKRDSNEQTPLHLAASGGHADVARWLLANGADVNATAYNSFTPLHLAKEPQLVKLLLAHKADFDAKDSSGTALEMAASSLAHCERLPELKLECEKLREIVQLLLAAGAGCDIRSACYLGDVKRVQVLVSDKKQARDKQAMRAAATYGRAEIVKLLLESGADPENADYGGLTVSYFAIEHPNVLKLLFAAGADPKVKVDYHGNGQGPQGSTLLHEAAGKGALESVKLLLARGLPIDAQTPTGWTPLHQACHEGHVSTVELLLMSKADPKFRTKNGWTPLSLAADRVRPEHEEDNARFQAVIQALARTGVEVDAFASIALNDVPRIVRLLRADPKLAATKDPNGGPMLHHAVMLDRREMVKLFLDNGSDPDIRSDQKISGHFGATALLDAAFWGRLEIAEMLIERKADVNAKAKRGVVPLHEAARMRNVEIARLLLKHGADVNAEDSEGKTPLDWAGLYRTMPEMVELLKSHGGVGIVGPKTR